MILPTVATFLSTTDSAVWFLARLLFYLLIVIAPLLIAFTLFAIFSIFYDRWQLRAVREIERKTQARLCIHCGYDLRATPDRCPECGTLRFHA